MNWGKITSVNKRKLIFGEKNSNKKLKPTNTKFYRVKCFFLFK